MQTERERGRETYTVISTVPTAFLAEMSPAMIPGHVVLLPQAGMAFQAMLSPSAMLGIEAGHSRVVSSTEQKLQAALALQKVSHAARAAS